MKFSQRRTRTTMSPDYPYLLSCTRAELQFLPHCKLQKVGITVKRRSNASRTSSLRKATRHRRLTHATPSAKKLNPDSDNKRIFIWREPGILVFIYDISMEDMQTEQAVSVIGVKSWPFLADNTSNLCSKSSIDLNFLSLKKMQEKGGNRLVPGLDHMVDALKLPNQVSRVSGESLQTWVAWRCPDGTQHLFCWPILGVSGQSLALNGPAVDSRYLNLSFGSTETTHSNCFLSSPTKYTVEPSWMLVLV
ncbi:hypothetical protein TNCV_4365221 [Trichonephila clavipes]|nr:hypothetical protein TNCV_4365221 [Trichonephila clavipes]